MTRRRVLVNLMVLLTAAQLRAQSINGTVIRITPTVVPLTCNTGDIRVDQNEANMPRICQSNTWVDMLYLGGASFALNRVIISSATGSLTSSTTSATEVAQLSGVTSQVCGINQSCILTNKIMSGTSNTFSNIPRASIATGNTYRVVTNDSGGALADAAAITASRALISDANGIPTHSTTMATELSYVSGVTSAIQTQLNNKQVTGSYVTTGSLGNFTVPSVIGIIGGTAAVVGSIALSFTNETVGTFFAGPASGSPAAPTFRNILGADLPTPGTGTIGGVMAFTAVSNQWINAINTNGSPSSTQPGFSNLSGTAAATQLPIAGTGTVGATMAYNSVANQWINAISGTTGSPTSTQPNFTNLAGTATSVQLPVPTTAAIGGVMAYVAVTNQWINAISTTGSPTSTQPSFANISSTVAGTQLPGFAGDITNSNQTLTIGANKVTLADIAQINSLTILGRTVASTGNVTALTGAQVTSILSNFIGDTGSGGTAGLVPAPATGDAAANKFLNASGNWTAVTGSSPTTGYVVTPLTTGNVRVIGAEFRSSTAGVACNQTTCTKVTNVGSGFGNIIRNGTGDYNCTPTTAFTGTPVCTCSTYSESGTGQYCVVVSTATASINIRTINDNVAGGSAADGHVNIQCMGPN